MLKQRLLTIAILLPLFVWCVIVLPTRYFAALIAFVVLLAAREWSGLMGIRANSQRLLYVAVVLAAMIACAWLTKFPAMRQWLLGGAVAWWVASLLLIRWYEANPLSLRWLAGDTPDGHFHPNWLLGILGIVVLVPAWLSLVILHGSTSPAGVFVLLLMSLIWAADSGAYLVGRRWGKAKLASRVSPGKTWEGVYGGIIAAIIVAVIGGRWIGFGLKTQVSIVLLAIVAVLFSIAGDLFESLVKRMAGVKDSGHLLPGHGGVLDRIDSVTAAAPLFVFGLLWQGMIA